jgi:C-3',4' desaturase CrtD
MQPLERTEVIVIGSGMGGMAAGCMLAKDGYEVTILEAAHVPGGCSSSYKRKGYIFESGATTLIGFDEHQPLQTLEKELGITLQKNELVPSMTVHQGGEHIIRYKDRQKWIDESYRAFGTGTREQHQAFWKEAFMVADTVWKVSKKNIFFPPRKATDWIQMAINNNPADAPVLRYAFQSIASVMKKFGVDSPDFRRFVDEQLMITAQTTAEDTPFIFAAPGLTYTNYSNYYVPGGLLKMVQQLQEWLEAHGGRLKTRQKVTKIESLDEAPVVNGNGHSSSGPRYLVETDKGRQYHADIVISNIPIWNMPGIMQRDEHMKNWYDKYAKRYDKAWGAYTMGVVTGDAYDDDMTLHHQLHLPEGQTMPHTGARSVFVSMSQRGDTERAPEGERTLNISCHSYARPWFEKGPDYDAHKAEVEEFILDFLKDHLPGFNASGVKLSFAATPVTWQNWVYRKDGRVGGIPQSMARSLVDWTPSETPFEGLFQCGDTVYPGQGIPGVTLGGINVYYRVKKNHAKPTASGTVPAAGKW